MIIRKYKDGKFLDKDGYVLVPMPKDEEELFKPLYNFKGMGYEHRIVMAKELKRLLHANERPHHKDRNRTNNSPENLIVKDVIEHLLEHKAQGDLKLFSKDYQPRWKKMEKKDNLKVFKKNAADISKSTALILGSSFGSIPGLMDFWKARHYQGKTKQNLQLNGLKKGLIGAGLGMLAGNIGRVALNGEETAWKNLSTNIKPSYTKQVALGTLIGSLPGAIDFARAKDSDKRQKALKKGSIGASIGASIGGVNSLINRL